VVAEAALKAPQAPGGLALAVKLTASPETTVPLKFLTVAVIVELVEPFAGRMAAVATRVMTFGGAV
jgi:hypothetical protein